MMSIHAAAHDRSIGATAQIPYEYRNHVTYELFEAINATMAPPHSMTELIMNEVGAGWEGVSLDQFLSDVTDWKIQFTGTLVIFQVLYPERPGVHVQLNTQDIARNFTEQVKPE